MRLFEDRLDIYRIKSTDTWFLGLSWDCGMDQSTEDDGLTTLTNRTGVGKISGSGPTGFDFDETLMFEIL